MKLTVTDTKTGDIVYCCITEGDLENPSRIEETGSDMQNFKDAAYNKIQEQRHYIRDTILNSSPGAYKIANVFQNAVDYINEDAGEILYSITIEDITYPEPEEDPRDDRCIVDEDDLILTRNGVQIHPPLETNEHRET